MGNLPIPIPTKRYLFDINYGISSVYFHLYSAANHRLSTDKDIQFLNLNLLRKTIESTYY